MVIRVGCPGFGTMWAVMLLLHQGLGITTAAVVTDPVPVMPGWWQQLCQGGQEPGRASACGFVTGTWLWAPGRLHRWEGWFKLRFNYLCILQADVEINLQLSQPCGQIASRDPPAWHCPATCRPLQLELQFCNLPWTWFLPWIRQGWINTIFFFYISRIIYVTKRK